MRYDQELIHLEQTFGKQQFSNLELVFYDVAVFFLLITSSAIDLLFRAALKLDRNNGKLV